MMHRPLLLFIKRQLPRERRNSFDVYYVFFSFTAAVGSALMALVMHWLEQPRIATSVGMETLVLIATLVWWTQGLSDFGLSPFLRARSCIALAEQARIFEPFIQLTRIDTRDNARDALRGNGLGLSITDTLVKSHGGQLTVHSAVDQGSTFSFRIPGHIAPVPHKPLPTLDRVDTSAFKLLIVDDHAVNRLVAKATLQRAIPNAHIEEAENGLTDFAKISEPLYGVVLLDTVHVIALTANGANEALIACKKVGMDEVMSKPFDRHTLVNRDLHCCLKNQ
jgi:CheY-like chemotaxis protein